MYLNYFLTFLLMFQSSISNAQIQNIENYNISKPSKECLILSKKNTNLDTLCLRPNKVALFNRNQTLEIIDNQVFKIKFIIIGIGNFSNNFYEIEQWNIRNDKFVLKNSLKIPQSGCHLKRLKFFLRKNGIKWTYGSRFWKRKKGLIPYTDLKTKTEYILPCKD